MDIDDKLVKKLKDEHYEAVSIRHELEADIVALIKENGILRSHENINAALQENHEELLEYMREIYELLSGKKYAELFKALSDLIYRTIGRVV